MAFGFYVNRGERICGISHSLLLYSQLPRHNGNGCLRRTQKVLLSVPVNLVDVYGPKFKRMFCRNLPNAKRNIGPRCVQAQISPEARSVQPPDCPTAPQSTVVVGRLLPDLPAANGDLIPIHSDSPHRIYAVLLAMSMKMMKLIKTQWDCSPQKNPH